MHIIKHKDTNKPRGCFVEFATRDDLEKGLMKDGAVRMLPSRLTSGCSRTTLKLFP